MIQQLEKVACNNSFCCIIMKRVLRPPSVLKTLSPMKGGRTIRLEENVKLTFLRPEQMVTVFKGGRKNKGSHVTGFTVIRLS